MNQGAGQEGVPQDPLAAQVDGAFSEVLGDDHHRVMAGLHSQLTGPSAAEQVPPPEDVLDSVEIRNVIEGPAPLHSQRPDKPGAGFADSLRAFGTGPTEPIAPPDHGPGESTQPGEPQ